MEIEIQTKQDKEALRAKIPIQESIYEKRPFLAADAECCGSGLKMIKKYLFSVTRAGGHCLI